MQHSTINTAHYETCRNIQKRCQQYHTICCFILLGLAGWSLLSLSGYFYIIPLAAPVSEPALYLPAILWTIVVVVAGFIATPEHPLRIGIFLLLVVLTIPFHFWAVYTVLPAVLAFGSMLILSPKAIWMTKQEGYPYFNERFTQQQMQEQQDPFSHLPRRSSTHIEFPELPRVSLEKTTQRKDRVEMAEAVPLTAAPQKAVRSYTETFRQQSDAAQFSTDTSHYDKCRTAMHTHETNHKYRMAVLFVLSITNGFFHIMPLGQKIPIAGLYLGMLAWLYMILLLVLAFFATAERPKVFWIFYALLALAAPARMMAAWVAILLLIVFFKQFSECRNAAWMKLQPGYPYFSERFEEQLTASARGFQPRHQFRETPAEMQDVSVPEPAAESPKTTEMPDIPTIPEDEPLPVWDLPDPTIASSDLTTPIPDLPELPEIPKF